MTWSWHIVKWMGVEVNRINFFFPIFTVCMQNYLIIIQSHSIFLILHVDNKLLALDIKKLLARSREYIFWYMVKRIQIWSMQFFTRSYFEDWSFWKRQKMKIFNMVNWLRSWMKLQRACIRVTKYVSGKNNTTCKK